MAFPQMDGTRVIVVGAGIAGLATALHLAPMPVTVLTETSLGLGTATAWAQGGIAAALGPDDAPERHAADTLAAGAGLSEPDIAAAVAEAAPGCIEWLARQGVCFDLDPSGALALGREAAHGRRRIVHAGGDATGRTVLESLGRAARAAPSIELVEGARVVDLIVEDCEVVGLVRAHADGSGPIGMPACWVVLATGGIGGLFADTTNPRSAVGRGLAIAARAGAVLRDLEFVQFHPTAIATGADPMPLATEALRGEGAVLVNGRGERFMAEMLGAELAPRDVVARAVFEQTQRGQSAFLDARALGPRFGDRFPSVAALCRAAGLDPARHPIPVRPAAHYHMGGVKVDRRGRSSVAGLWACGEVASTGLHGANRLASNSLLEALAAARWIADDIAGIVSVPRDDPNSEGRPHAGDEAAALSLTAVRRLMSERVGLVRDEAGLTRAVRRLAGHLAARPGSDPGLAALLVATAALRRRESRGAHVRSDHPAMMAPRHAEITLQDAAAAVGALDVTDRHPWREVA